MSLTPTAAHAEFLRHLLDPPHVGELDDADWIGEAGSLGQGEYIRLFARAEAERFTEVRFMAMGCSATLAAASALTELLQGQTLATAAQIGSGEIALRLGELPQDQAHGAHLAAMALLALLADAKGEILPPGADRLVCTCYRVSEGMLRQAISTRHLKSLDDVTAATMAGKGCRSCHREIHALLAEARGPKPRFLPAAPPQPSLQQQVAQVMDQLDLLKPRLRSVGTDVTLLDLAGNRLIVQGTSLRCPDGSEDLRGWLERELRDRLWPSLTVEMAS